MQGKIILIMNYDDLKYLNLKTKFKLKLIFFISITKYHLLILIISMYCKHRLIFY